MSAPSHGIVARMGLAAAAVTILSGILLYAAGRAGEPGSAGLVLVMAGAGSAAVIVYVSRRVYRDWLEPIRQLTADTARMSGGTWHFRAGVPDAAELRALAEAINHLGAEAQQQLADLRQQRRDLQVLVDTLPDPIIVTDAQQHVALANAAAARLLGRTPFQLLGKPLADIVTKPAIMELHEQVIHPSSPAREGEYAHREIRVERAGKPMTFQAAAVRLETGGALLVLRDITSLAAAMQMKTDFVANASHELRTPIAAIKIAFETLRDVYTDDPRQTDRCITVIDGHLSRLEELLRNLLDLSRVESPDISPQIADVDAGELFASLNAALGPVARQKGLELIFDQGGLGQPVFASDPRLLNLAVKNLVENAIKFTPAGGRVIVMIARSGGAVRLSVSDTGIGIPPEHVERVFERFYQVDPARSGSAGRGTGLGLAIVKHAVAALSGTVSIASEVGKGTTVTCILPQA